MNGVGCSCCHGFTIVKGINDVATTHPEYVKYFVHEEDSHTITYGSSRRVELKCPVCGTLKEMPMDRFHTQGLGCQKCGDGVSYPEKFLRMFIEQLNLDFTYQLSKKDFTWCGESKYDFYLPKYNCILEIHGEQHYTSGAHFNSKNIRNEQDNDNYKRKLAISNGIKHYFELDCRESKIEWIKTSIISSGLLDLLDISEEDVDWNKCQEYTAHSLLKDACDYKNAHPDLSTTEIAKVFKLRRTTIQTYLQRGSELGICIYDKEYEKKMAQVRAVKSRKRNKQKNNE